MGRVVDDPDPREEKAEDEAKKGATRMREPKSRTRQRVARMQSARKFKVVLTTADYNPSPAKVFFSLVPFLEHFRKKGFLLAGETPISQ